MDHQDHLEGLDRMVRLDFQVRKVIWVPWDHQDRQEDQGSQEVLVLLDLKVNLDSPVEMAHQVLQALKERGETLASQDCQDLIFHHRP